MINYQMDNISESRSGGLIIRENTDTHCSMNFSYTLARKTRFSRQVELTQATLQRQKLWTGKCEILTAF